jgi:aspartyl-tRNA(Asn)/glutamyl-tRNA(Gln) amidotransferase subunit A
MTALEGGVRGLRLARLPAAERQGVAADVLQAYDRSLAALAGLGAEIVDIELPWPLVEFVAMNNVTMAEAYFANRAVVDDPASKMDDVVRGRMLTGAAVSAQDYLTTLRRRDRMKLEMEAALAGTHALLTPSTDTAAIALADIDYTQQPTRFARFVNLLDMCALALPNGFTAAGLPTSLQIACRGYEEALALRIGHAYQQSTDWHERLPPAVALPLPGKKAMAGA